jgi:hypothetical protein
VLEGAGTHATAAAAVVGAAAAVAAGGKYPRLASTSCDGMVPAHLLLHWWVHRWAHPVLHLVQRAVLPLAVPGQLAAAGWVQHMLPPTAMCGSLRSIVQLCVTLSCAPAGRSLSLSLPWPPCTRHARLLQHPLWV